MTHYTNKELSMTPEYCEMCGQIKRHCESNGCTVGLYTNREMIEIEESARARADELPHIKLKTKESRQFYVGSHLITVDEEMIPILSKFTWHVNKDKQTFYAQTSVKIGGKTHCVSMHRLLTGLLSSEIDHINRNGLDNRLDNLRHATKKQNSYNRKRKNKFGLRGVFKRGESYSFQIQKDYKKVTGNGFATAEEAAAAYDAECIKLHGEFGLLNFPKGSK